MKCLVYITHKMDDAIYRYLSYLMKERGGEYTFEEAGLYPTHYIQVTGVYDEKGVTFWHWGKEDNHSTNVDTHFIFKIQKP